LELVSILLTSFAQDQFYRGANDTFDRVRALMAQVDKKFAAKAAIYARTEYGMRSISHTVAAEIARTVHGEQWTKRFFEKIVYRPDDILEILSLYDITKNPIPNCVKRGFGKVLSGLNEYKLAKYRASGKGLKLVDVVNLIHPKHTEALGKLIRGELKADDTWEKELTQAGQRAKSDEERDQLKKEVWVKLISERKLGYFALLRNLRNIIEQSPEIVPDALSMLVEPGLIKSSLVLPFRHQTAIEALANLPGKMVREVRVAINRAVDIAVDNVPKFDGETLVALDVSGSMEGRPAEIGGLFAAVLAKSNNADIILFSDNAAYVSINPADSTLTIAQSIRNAAGGTNFNAVFGRANRKYDRIIFLSDMQGWIGGGAPTRAFADYKAKYLADPKIYSFDLAGYGSLQFPERNIYCLTGFSEKVFDIIKLLEIDRAALVNEIEKVEL
jgi:hypothetical protein